MKKVIFATQKGGGGKSTATMVIATALSQAPYNKRVLVVDIDSQFGTTDARKRDALLWLKEKFPGKSPEEYQKALPKALDHLAKASFDFESCGYALLDPKQAKEYEKDANRFKEIASAKELKDSEGKPYDYVFFDVPGSADLPKITKSLFYADHVFIPVRPSLKDIDSVKRYFQTLHKFLDFTKEKRGVEPVLHSFMMDVKTNRKETTFLNELLPRVPRVKYIPNYISNNVRYERADTVYSVFSDTTKDYAKVQKELKAFLKEFLEATK